MRQTTSPRRVARRIGGRGGVVLAVVATAAAAGVVTSVKSDQAAADPAPSSAFVAIQRVQPNVRPPSVRRTGSQGVFRVDCGTNGNRKLSPDNPVAQPGIKNAAQHVHDFVGNLSISAESSDESLDQSGTTCRNGDKSSYFWPVVRIIEPAAAGTGGSGASGAVSGASGGGGAGAPEKTGTPRVSCPTVANRLPAVPAGARAELTRELRLLDEQIQEADRRLTADGAKGADFVNNAILGPLRQQRVAALDRIAEALRRNGSAATGLISLAECDLDFDHAMAGRGHGHGSSGAAQERPVVTPTVNCPTVRDRLPNVPAPAVRQVNRDLTELDRHIAGANQRLVSTQGQRLAAIARSALGPLRTARAVTLDRIAGAIERAGGPRVDLTRLADCSLTNPPADSVVTDPSTTGNGAQGATPSATELPGAEGRDLEIAGNLGGIVRPAEVKIEYRGNATSKVVPMPKFLKMITGDAKPTSRGPANARASWTCSGFGDRLSDKYVICPQGSRVVRVHDFPSCWDGKNTDSANHRTHIVFPDPTSGACPAGTKAVPQLRITISYDIQRAVQKKGLYQLDSFPEENHNPFSDHDDFANVNSAQTMQKIANCINTGRRCA